VVPIEPAAMAGRSVVQWDKDDCADLGIIKVDLLGLGMLNVLEEAVPLVRDKEGVSLDLAHLPPDDPKTYAMIRRADTVGVFQIESRAQMASLPRNAPRRFYDLVVQVAIIRPGPIAGGMANPYFERRLGRQAVTYPHPCLEPILERTLGVVLFQEQILRIAMEAAGFTGGEAESLRRAMGSKRSLEQMNAMEDKLRRGMAERGVGEAARDEIVQAIRSFALYGFPESHAASFALIAYASAYLKAHHPTAFLVALLNAWPMGFYHPATLVKDAQRSGVEVRPIEVGRSGVTCRWEEAETDAAPDPRERARRAEGSPQPAGACRLGLKFVKGLRAAAAQAIEREAARAPFADVDDLARRTALRDAELAALAAAGALAPFGARRSHHGSSRAGEDARGCKASGGEPPQAYSKYVEDGDRPTTQQTGADSPAQQKRGETCGLTRRAALWQVARAGRPAGPLLAHLPDESPSPLPEMSSLDETLADYAHTGLSAGPHPVRYLRPALAARGVVPTAELPRRPNGTRITMAGSVVVRQRPGTARGLLFMTLEDETGMAQAIVSPDLLAENRRLLIGSSGLIVEGILQKRDGTLSVKAERFWPLSEIARQEVAATPSHDFR